MITFSIKRLIHTLICNKTVPAKFSFIVILVLLKIMTKHINLCRLPLIRGKLHTPQTNNQMSNMEKAIIVETQFNNMRLGVIIWLRNYMLHPNRFPISICHLIGIYNNLEIIQRPFRFKKYKYSISSFFFKMDNFSALLSTKNVPILASLLTKD